jgi:hypothetical protein
MNVQPKREGFVDPETPPPSGNGSTAATQEPAPAAAAPPPVPDRDERELWPIRVKLLHKPIRNMQGDTVHELVFREPTAGDINRYGNPCRISSEGEVVFDEQKMMRIIAALSGLLIPLIEAMDPRDWNSCAYRLRNFFLPEMVSWL